MPCFTKKSIYGIACLLALSILVFGSLQASAQTPGISLSEEQKKWLTEHPVLRLGVGVAFPP